MAIEYADAEIITKSDIRAMLMEKGATFDEAETNAENLPVSGHLILAINPEERLDRIIEQVKESYIRHHLKSKSLRGITKQCGLSRKLVRRINNKLATNDYGQQL
jgi:hypothetical protein